MKSKNLVKAGDWFKVKPYKWVPENIYPDQSNKIFEAIAVEDGFVRAKTAGDNEINFKQAEVTNISNDEKPVITRSAKIHNIRRQIEENNDIIAKTSKQNLRLFNRLMHFVDNDEETNARINAELASDTWKSYSQDYASKLDIDNEPTVLHPTPGGHMLKIHAFSKALMYKLLTYTWKVHIEFYDQSTLEDYMIGGFDVEKWEQINKMKVIVRPAES